MPFIRNRLMEDGHVKVWLEDKDSGAVASYFGGKEMRVSHPKYGNGEVLFLGDPEIGNLHSAAENRVHDLKYNFEHPRRGRKR